MQNIPTKVDGVDVLPADQYNQPMDELENAIESTGITLSAGDLFQIAKTIANYSGSGNFFTDSGAADAYVLSVVSSKQGPTAYVDGMEVRFEIGNTNTGASTVNINGLGVKNVKTPGGADPAAGDLTVGDKVTLHYDDSAGYFIIYDKATGPLASKIIQMVNVQDGEVATGTSTTSYDDTIPQNTEGDEYMTLAITPTNLSNQLEIDITINLTSNTSGDMVVALFQDSAANALAAVDTVISPTITTSQEPTSFKHVMTAGTTSLTTFKVRAGLHLANTTTFNGNGGARKFGGVCASSITIREIGV